MELSNVIQSDITVSDRQNILDNFTSFFKEIKQRTDEAMALVVTSEDQVDKMKKAKSLRLEISKIRISADKTRKRLKQDSINYGRAVQSVYKIIEGAIKPVENHLKKQENFLKIIEENKRLKLREERTALMSGVGEYEGSIDLGSISELEFKTLLAGHKANVEAEKQRLIEEEKRRKEDDERRIREAAERLAADKIRKAKEETEAAIQKVHEQSTRAAEAMVARVTAEREREKEVRAKEDAASELTPFQSDKQKILSFSDKLITLEDSIPELELHTGFASHVRGRLSQVSLYLKETLSTIS